MACLAPHNTAAFDSRPTQRWLGASSRAGLLMVLAWGLALPVMANEPVVETPHEAPPLTSRLSALVQNTLREGADWLSHANPVPLVLEQGAASYYANRFHGRRTASGEPYDKNELTAAHKTLPFGTKVIVRSLQTGREVAVRITDRGPHLKNRIIDLSHAAAAALGIQGHGVSEVQLIEKTAPQQVGAQAAPY